MDQDTDIGGQRDSFPTTRHSVVEATRSADLEVRRQALDTLIAAYWKPAYKYVRIKWKASNEDAKDLTQGFFCEALEKEYLERFNPAKARFRTYLRVCLDGYVANQRKAAGRLKRGGHLKHVSFDFESAEGEIRQLEIADDADMEDYFYQEWVRSLFARAVESLRAQLESADKSIQFELFNRYDLERPASGMKTTYDQLASEFGIPATQVTNYLAAARRLFRSLVLDELRKLSGSDEEFRSEAKELLGVDPA